MISKPIYECEAATNQAAYLIGVMKGYKRYLSPQEYSTIKGQAIAGDVEGAKRGLTKLLRKKGVFDDEECI